MKTSEALKRLHFTISKGNKPNNIDIEALNQIIRDQKKQAEETTKEHYLFAKLYAVVLRSNTEFHGDIVKANKVVNKILSDPLEDQLQRLLLVLKHQNISNYFESKSIFDPLLNKENFETYKKLFPEISKEGIDYAFNAWDMENLKSHFQFTVNQSLINFKNND